MMAKITSKKNRWDIGEIQSMEKEVERYVQNFCNS